MRVHGHLGLVCIALALGCARDDWNLRRRDASLADASVADASVADARDADAKDAPSDASNDVPTDAAPLRRVRQIVSSGHTTFAVRDDGAVFAAGQGAGAFEGVEGAHRNLFTRVVGLDGVEEVSVASTTPLVLCARLGDGTVRCKDGSTSPVPVQGISDARRIAGPCALRADGGVACWTLGELRAVDVTFSRRDVVGLASNGAYHCALRGDGTVWCWGAAGATIDVPTSTRTVAAPEQVMGLTPASAIAVGPRSACAALTGEGGGVLCWGHRSAIDLGLDGSSALIPVSRAGRVRTLTVNSGLRDDGHVIVWGTGATGTRGDGSYTPTQSAVVAAPELTATALAEGDADDHVCAVDADGQARCWGSDDNGQLARGGGAQRWPLPALLHPEDPADATPLGGVEDLMQSASASCALRTVDGARSLWCWGSPEQGTLGDGTIATAPPWRFTPTLIRGLGDVASVASAGSTTEGTFCAAMRDGSARCWGLGASGMIGDGAGIERARPTAPAGLTNVDRVVVGASHACAILTDATVSCWGRGGSGEIGDGSTADALRPVAVAGLTEVRDLALGPDVSVALRRDGSMYLWGSSMGVLSTSRLNPRPVRLPDLLDATQIIAVMPHNWRQVCALQSTRRVSCLGQNLARADAWIDMGLEGVTQLAGSPASVGCARHDDGTVSCWGHNRNACLGDPSLPNVDDYMGPQRVLMADAVTPFDHVTRVRPGIGMVCAVRDDATLWCWGATGNGMTARGFAQKSSTPRRTLGM